MYQLEKTKECTHFYFKSYKILYNSNESKVTADQRLPGEGGRRKKIGRKDDKGAGGKFGGDRYAYSLDCGDGR